MPKQAFQHQLAQRIGRMPDPVNYHAGIPLPDLSLPTGINMFPRPQGERPFYHEPKVHPFRYILILALQGTGCVVLNNELIPLHCNESLLIFPGQMHHYVNLNVPTRQWFFITFQLVSDHAIINLRSTVAHVYLKTWQLVDALVADYRSPRRNAPEVASRISHRLWLLLIHLSTRQTRRPHKPQMRSGQAQRDYALLLKIQRHLEGSLAKSIRVEAIAEHAGISRSRLQERFSALMGMGIANYIRRHRLKLACQMISTTHDSLTRVAELCGFSSLYSFSRTFKRQWGISPLEYRRRLRR